MDNEELKRLLLVVITNTHALEDPKSGQLHQGLFPQYGAMTNHSCVPNCTHTWYSAPASGKSAESEEGRALCMALRAVRDIARGEELTISYLDDLMAPFEERAETLRTRYLFDGATKRPCDDWLAAVVCGEAAYKERAPQIIACNEAADAAWRRATDLAAPGYGQLEGQTEVRRLRMEAVVHYAELLKLASGCLHADHRWVHNARVRTAMVMTASGAPRSCANALPLWRASMAAALKCYPPHWPSTVPLLKGGCSAASVAGDERLLSEWKELLKKTESVLARST
mmetsp:Transcript_24917/g.62791  ORF Transcript_24917/g.62791 Transcript_24917/m.62791 type:complete len:284 (+) Transcript_24917:737-1588(+)